MEISYYKYFADELLHQPRPRCAVSQPRSAVAQRMRSSLLLDGEGAV